MKHLIMGTAGHIDHGKTALVRALTGIECDTHPEEKRRGITINLGFAYLDFLGGPSVGIIDVPGHHDFVHTMVGGASSIDFGMLVIGANEGIMPQAREHLQIMEVLGVKSGLVALNKIDLVDPELRAVVVRDVEELVHGTFLEAAPVVPVSALTGEGIGLLKERIAAVAEATAQKPPGAVFRLFVDRIFEAKGFGHVLTGSVLSGALAVGEVVHLLPGHNLTYRVRGIHRHGQAVERVAAGDRAAVNLVGLQRADVERGMMLASEGLPPSPLLDVRLQLFREAAELPLWSQVVFYLGTHETQAKIHLLDKDSVSGGEEALAQVHLEKPVPAFYGDRFVLRDSSGAATLGGGQIVDAQPLHHRRRPPKLVDHLRRLASGGSAEAAAAEVRKRRGPVSHLVMTRLLNVQLEEFMAGVVPHLPEDILTVQASDGLLFIERQEYERLADALLERIAEFHRQNPLEAGGPSAQELTGLLGLTAFPQGRQFLAAMLGALQAAGRIKVVGSTHALSGHQVVIGEQRSKAMDFVASFLKKAGMQVPLMAELQQQAKAAGFNEQQVKQTLRYLVEKKEAYPVDDSFANAEVVDACRKKLLSALVERPQGMTVAEFRDLIGANRKLCLSLFALYDAEGVTLRKGDVRVITARGRERIEG